MCCRTKISVVTKWDNKSNANLNKRHMGHIAYLKNQFKSTNTFARSYDCIILLIWRGENLSSPFYTQMVLICKTVSPLHQSMLYAKFGFNWPNGSGVEDFKIMSMYYSYIVIIFTWKRMWLFIWINLSPLHTRMFRTKFGWNWRSGSLEEFFL